VSKQAKGLGGTDWGDPQVFTHELQALVRVCSGPTHT
jgi:hypothetical protein